jgi:AraC-like DNA-binding protein
MNKKILLIICFFLIPKLFAQKKVFIIPDTIQDKDYEYLFQRIEDLQGDSKTQLLYLKSFLNKAKSENNSEEIVNGYKNYLHYSNDSLKIVYADSMIYAARKTTDKKLIGSAYISKGIVYYIMKKHKLALDNYLIANKFISQTDDKYLMHKVKYNIASIKYYLGFYDEAISLFKQCMVYYGDENDDDYVRPYLNSIHLLGLCYNRIGNFGLCTEMNVKGLSEAKRLSNDEMNIYFIHSEGINQYFKENYQTAIKKITSVINLVKKEEDFGNESVGYFYIGASYWKLSEPEKALPYLKKVDKIFSDKNYIRPDLIQNYQLLIDYYKSKKNLEEQLYYSSRLLKADSVLDNKYHYLTRRIHKDYDTSKIVLDMESMERSLKIRKYNDLIFVTVATGFVFAFGFLFYRFKSNKKKYQKNFMELMKKNEENQLNSKINSATIDDINQATVLLLLKKLESFENDKKYLEKDVTLSKLAVLFNTNINYLYKIIYHHREKNFTDYINDLKIDYIINLLKQDKMFRNYTNKALAEEAGFSTTQRFANAFFARTGVPTSYFINEIKKSTEI